VIFGAGALVRLSEAAAKLGAKKVLVAAGTSAMAEAGIIDRVNDILSGFEVHFHQGVRVNLPLDACDALIRSVRESGAELVVGLGGGSVLDGAKAAALMAPGGGWTRDYIKGKAPANGLPFIGVPTTSGTGSEVTPSMIFMDTDAEKKLSYARMEATARAAIVDPELTLSLPPDQTAATGLDALSHGFEAYWSKLANPVSDALALESVSIIIDHLERAYNHPDDLEARTAMAYGSLCAGLSFSQTATAALHGLTYPLTARFSVPHGMACAFLMREVFGVNFHHLEAAKQKRLLHNMKSNTIGAAIDLLTDLFKAVKAPGSLADLEIPEGEINRFVDEAGPVHLERNVAPLSREKIREMWKKKIR
jgi:alcohol dehydrogenase